MSESTVPPDVAVPAAAAAAKRAGNQAMFFVAVFELLKAALFLAAAFGLLRMMHKDTGVELGKLLHAMRISGDQAFIKSLLLKANVIDDPHKRIFGALAATYAVLHGIEGVGLMWRKKWAEYLTVIASSLAIPYEVYELFHRTTHPAHATVLAHIPDEQRASFVFDKLFLLKLGIFIANVGIVWFLVAHLRRQHRAEKALEHGVETASEVRREAGAGVVS